MVCFRYGVVLFLGSLSASFLFAEEIEASPPAQNASPPNIVFILADDLGYGDLACYGAPDTKTPHLDKLASEGLRFTQFYGNGAECTPTRTAILTGRYPSRAGGLDCAIGTGNVGRYDDATRLAKTSQLGLPVEQAVIPGIFTKAGYRSAIFGKWHLGYEPHFNPLKYGWDQFFGVLGGNCDYYTHKELSPLPVLYDGAAPIDRDGYLTHLITEDAVSFIDKQAASNSPFFLYLPYTAPHFPFQAPGDTGSIFTAENWTKGPRSAYVSMVEDLDAQVGTVLASLESNGLSGNTLVIFASDHGAMVPGLNAPLRGHKGGLFEGGIRAPLIAKWPGHLEGGKVNATPFLSMDLTASFARIVGADVASLNLDGVDMFHHAEVAVPAPARGLFWRAKRGTTTWNAVRIGHWKYIYRMEGGVPSEWIFNIAEDPEEQVNLLELPQGRNLRSMCMGALKQWDADLKPAR